MKFKNGNKPQPQPSPQPSPSQSNANDVAKGEAPSPADIIYVELPFERETMDLLYALQETAPNLRITGMVKAMAERFYYLGIPLADDDRGIYLNTSQRETLEAFVGQACLDAAEITVAVSARQTIDLAGTKVVIPAAELAALRAFCPGDDAAFATYLSDLVRRGIQAYLQGAWA